MKTENIIFWAAGAGAIILVVYILVKKAKDKAAAEKAAAQAAANANQATTPGSTPSGSGSGTNTGGSLGTPLNLDYNKLLKINVQAPNEVKFLQGMLNQFGKNLVIDGQFGPATETALRQVTDGVYSQITIGQFLTLFPNGAGTTSTNPNLTPDTNTSLSSGSWSWYNPFSWSIW